MEPIDLSIPIYLNQQVVFDLLAIFDDGFSTLSTIKTSSSESEINKYGMGASIGVSNVFALLGISFSGERGKQKDLQDQKETSAEKIHTPTSLFAKLRSRLQENELIRGINNTESLEDLKSGEFVEFQAVLRKNPLVETIESFKELMEMAILFEDGSSKGGQQKGNKYPKNPNTALIKQMDGLLMALNQSNSIELIGELIDVIGVKAVLTARPDFFSQGSTAEIIDGEFRVLGKVVRVLKPGSKETINLLRETTFGMFDQRLFDQLSQALVGMESVGLRSSQLITEIGEPALLIIPIAIYT